MPDPRHIPTFDHRLQGRCDAPASKSATHRALVLAALSDGVSFIEKPLDAEDSQVTREGLGLLGIRSKIVDDGWEVYGTGGRIPGGANIELRESGTSCRFLTAVAALGQRPSRLDGAPRLRQRPLAALTEALTALGARCESDGGDGLPLRIGGAPLRGRRIALPASPSSQFVSALLMIGGLLPDGLHLTLARPWVSRGYVDMTMEMLESCGADVERS
ncbi:MAG: 3-phosphoshikimate 1-carboxyvinyltransferase, partial [Acidobacteriota bacterium]|nr:3-phosphoshikimate 1-carboxyvinyltransferase [Acidobacteriota bacterium]